MIVNIVIFFTVLSIVYLAKFLISFLVNFFSEEPKPMTLSKIDTVLIYLAVSYLITFIIRLPNV